VQAKPACEFGDKKMDNNKPEQEKQDEELNSYIDSCDSTSKNAGLRGNESAADDEMSLLSWIIYFVSLSIFFGMFVVVPAVSSFGLLILGFKTFVGVFQ